MAEHPEDQVVALQEQVRRRLHELRPLAADDESYPAATDAVIAAALELVDYEERLPLLVDREPRRLSLQIVRWSGVVAAAFGISLAVAAVAGWTHRWWLLPAVVVCAAAADLLRTTVPPPRGPHLALRPGAVVAGAGSAVVAIGAVASLPMWIAGIGGLVLAAGLWHLRLGQR